MSEEAKNKKCLDCCGKVIDVLAWLLILWGVGYTINSFVKACAFWEFYSTFFIFKLVVKRLGISLAAMLAGSLAIYLRQCCKQKNCS